MDNKHKILLAVGLTAILTDTIPTPADYFVFLSQQKNKERLEKGEITGKQYWLRSAEAYYLYNPLWWILVTGAVFLIGKDFNSKVYVGVGLISAGAVAGVITGNIKKEDQKF